MSVETKFGLELDAGTTTLNSETNAAKEGSVDGTTGPLVDARLTSMEETGWSY